jgi:hypothetical protein
VYEQYRRIDCHCADGVGGENRDEGCKANINEFGEQSRHSSTVLTFIIINSTLGFQSSHDRGNKGGLARLRNLFALSLAPGYKHRRASYLVSPKSRY